MFNLIGKAHAVTTNFGFNFIDQNRPINTVVVNILTWFIGVIGALAVIYLVYGGVMYITAGSDAEKAGKGRTAIVNAIIGIVIIAAAFLILRWVALALGSI